MKNKNLKLTTVDKFKISAAHTIVDKKDVAIWLHGITVDKDEYMNLFKEGSIYLANRGIDSLRIDFRGHGKSSGGSKDFTFVGQLIDIDAAINYVKSFYAKQKVKLHFIACSFGAPPAIYSCNYYSVESMTLIAPVLSYFKTFIEPQTDWAKQIFDKNKLQTLEKTNKLYINKGFYIGMNLYKEMGIVKPEIEVAKIKTRTIIIHGNQDSMVPYDVSCELTKNNKSLKLITMNNMDHGFNDINDELGTSKKSLDNKNEIYNIIYNNIINNV